MAKKRHDQNTTAADLISKVTKTPPPRGEDLLGSEELRRTFLEAKERAAKKRTRP